MTQGEAQRYRLFNEGAARFPRVFPDVAERIINTYPHFEDGFYVCPLCLKAFRREAIEVNMLSI
jgi:hypothetical protein